MTDDRARELLAAILHEIAPEVDMAELDQDADLGDEADLDSIDFMNLVEMIHERAGIEVPETDYARLSSINACVAYLAERAAA